MEWYMYLLIIGGGILTGFINTLSGNGSVISLPLLIFAGLPANVANGTNRVGILLQNLVGTASFHQKKVLDVRGALILSIPAVIGSLIGARIAVNLDETVIRRVIGVVMMIMLVLILTRPQRWLHGETQSLQGIPRWWNFVVFFAIGLYGGFIQVGVGIFLLSGLVLGLSYNLVRANAVKVAINFLFTVASLLVFQSSGQVAWIPGLVLAVGTMLGAWLAARMAVEKGAAWVHRLVVFVVVLSAIYLLGIFEWIGRLLGL
jgi:uncharacterized membrane protein YfcA